MATKPITYTEEFVTSQVEMILDIVMGDKDIIYLGEVFESLPYSRQRYSEWANTFKDNQIISDTIKRIDDILESRVNTAGLKGKANATMVIFNLKNNYGWEDKVTQRIEGSEENPLSIRNITDITATLYGNNEQDTSEDTGNGGQVVA